MSEPKTRRTKLAGRLRGVIARNVSARAAVQFKDKSNQVVAICEASAPVERERLIRSTVQRIMRAKTGATLEQIEKLAVALDLEPYQLFIEKLDASNPQVVKGAREGEEQVYALDKLAIKEAAKEGAREAVEALSRRGRRAKA